MRLLLVGPPGAGKGTQAKRLAAHYEIAHLASGDLLRREVERGTPIGKVAADYMRRGDPCRPVARPTAGCHVAPRRSGPPGPIGNSSPRTIPNDVSWRVAGRGAERARAQPRELVEELLTLSLAIDDQHMVTVVAEASCASPAGWSRCQSA